MKRENISIIVQVKKPEIKLTIILHETKSLS
jgi:hypothetical protein